MKKLLILLFVLISTCVFVYGQKENNKRTQIISGFDEGKPLMGDALITVAFAGSPEDFYLIPAYKGETKKSFLERIYFEAADTFSKVSLKLSDERILGEKSILANKEKSNDLPPWELRSQIICFFILFLSILGIFFVYKIGPKNRSW